MDLVAALTAAWKATASGDHTAALAAWERVVAANPVSGPFWHHLADAAYAKGAYERARAAYERALDLGFVFPWQGAYRIACCHARLGATEPALAWLERALRLGYRDRTAALCEPALESLRGDRRFLDLVGQPGQAPDRAAGWRQDLALLAGEVKRLGYAPFRTTPEAAFDAAVDALGSGVAARTDAEMVAGVMRLLAMVGDGHTRLEQRGRDLHPVLAQTLPLQAELFEDGLFVTAAEPRHADLLGARVEAIDGRPAADVLEALAPLVPRDHEHWVRAAAAQHLRQVRLLHGAGLARDPAALRLDVVDRSGGARSLLVAADAVPGDGAAARPHPDGWLWVPDVLAQAPLPAHLRAWARNYWFEHLPASHAVYFQFNRVADAPEEPLAAFAERLAGFVAAHAVARLVVDVRHNGGGNTFLEVPLLRRLLGLGGVRLFVIIGRRTFSAAQNFVTTLNRFTDAVFVGEPTGSGPNFVGETVVVALPWSGLRVSISDLFWQTSWPMDHRRWLAPDLYVPSTFAAFAANRDPALEAALSCDLDLPAGLMPPGD